jgi:DNA-binding PadR family transcriptional regulator
MVMDILQNKDLETREKLMLLLHKLGMVDRHRLATLLNLSVHTIDQTIKRLNKKNPDEKHIVSYSAPFNKGPKLYQLGPAGWKWVMEWIEEDRKYYQRSESQRRHYHGMTDILVRMIDKMGRDEALKRIQYLNTYEATELFLYPWQVIHWELWKDHKTKQEQSKGLPKPDIYLQVDEQGYWVEYDTSNESHVKIKEKYRRYYRAFNQLGSSSVSRKQVIWIAPTRSRIENMKSWLTLVERELEFREMKNDPPEMIFLVEGSDTDFFLSGWPSIGKREEEKKIRENI